MQGKAGSEDNWSKDRGKRQLGSEDDAAAWPTVSLQKLRSQDQVESPVATRYVPDSHLE